jgi:hypothetical protein
MPKTTTKKAVEKNPVGRPPEDLSSLPDEWYIDVLDLYNAGASDAEIKALIYRWRGSFSNDLWDRWIADYEEFSEAIKTGRLLAEGWWHQNGRTNLQNKEFNYTGWYMQMKNRFGWRDRTDHTTNDKDMPNIALVEFVSANKKDTSQDS